MWLPFSYVPDVAIASSLAARPTLCDLISAQAAVLEHNVSAQIAARYKRASVTGIGALGTLMLTCVPDSSTHDKQFREPRFVSGSTAEVGIDCTHEVAFMILRQRKQPVQPVDTNLRRWIRLRRECLALCLEALFQERKRADLHGLFPVSG